MRTVWEGHYVDGVTPARHSATVAVMASGLEIRLAAGGTRWWSFDSARQAQGRYAGEPVRLEHMSGSGEALIVPDAEFLSALRANTVGAARRRFHDPTRRLARISLTVAAGLAAITLGVGIHQWGIPALARLAAPLVPVAWEQRLGEEIFRRAFPAEDHCVNPERQRPLDAILTRLLAARPDTPYRVSLTVVRSAAVNAYALPGGRVVLLRGILDFADSPEMLAGTIAHEVAHVVHRHTTRSALEGASTAALLAAVAGDASGIALLGFEGSALIGRLRHRREHEAEADREGRWLLVAARIDPRGMMAFFEKLRERPGRMPGGPWTYLSTHPSDSERLAAMQADAARSTPAPLPLASEGEWAEIKRICDV